MTQSHIIDLVKSEPGILQSQLPERLKLKKRSISRNIKGLMRWNKIRREPVINSYALYLE